MGRVSSITPPSENSFQSLVPIGNTQWSIAVVSIWVPGGNRSQRRLSAPSDQSQYVGSKASASPAMRFVGASANRPVSARLLYVGRGYGSGGGGTSGIASDASERATSDGDPSGS